MAKLYVLKPPHPIRWRCHPANRHTSFRIEDRTDLWWDLADASRHTGLDLGRMRRTGFGRRAPAWYAWTDTIPRHLRFVPEELTLWLSNLSTLDQRRIERFRIPNISPPDSAA